MAGGSLGEIVDIPMTAHYLGGAVISDDPPKVWLTRGTGSGDTRAARRRRVNGLGEPRSHPR